MKNYYQAGLVVSGLIIIGFLGFFLEIGDRAQHASVGVASSTCAITVSSSTINLGESVTLSWVSEPNSTKHWLYGIAPDKNGRSVASSGSIVVAPTKTTPYTLKTELSGVVSSCGVRVIVNQNTTPPSPPLSCTFNSGIIAHGATVTAYQTSSAPAGGTCVSQVRTCSNGTLSGTYTFESCAVEALSLGQTNDGTPILGKVTSVDRVQYPTRTTVYWDNQKTYKEIPVGARVYINDRVYVIHIDSHVGNIYLPVNTAVSVGDTVAIRGVSPIVLPAPVIPPAPVVPPTPPAPAVASCVFNGNTVAHGAIVTAYQAGSVPAGNTCTSQVRTCTNGTLSGSYTFGSCSVAAPNACTFNGVAVAHGATVTAYQAGSVPAGSTCVPQVRTCTNGSLSGAYTFSSCSIAAPTGASCTTSVKVVALKEGVTGPANVYAGVEVLPYRNAVDTPQVIANSQSVTWYTKPYSQNGASCASLKVVRTCNNGTLSGNNALKYYSACVDLPTASSASHHPQRSDRPLSARTDSELLGLAFTEFNANKVVWTYARNMQKQGLAFPIQATLPGGRTTIPAETCSGSVSGSGPNADISSPSWRTSMLDFVKPKINDGIYSFQQDDPSSVFRTCASPNEINDFLRWFHDELRSYAQTVEPGATLTFSSNFTTYELSSSWIYQEYDFIESEVFAESGQSILTALRQLHPVYKTFSYPSIITIRSSDVLHNQRGIAQSYAFGVLPIIPWDVFFNFGPRYFGSPANFADYYKLVKDNPTAFDDYPMVELVDINSNAVQISGASGDTFIRKHQTQTNKKTVHVVRSAVTPVSMKLSLSASVFTNPPNAYITPAQTTPVAITPVLTNGRYEYTIPNAPLWTVLIYK